MLIRRLSLDFRAMLVSCAKLASVNNGDHSWVIDNKHVVIVFNNADGLYSLLHEVPLDVHVPGRVTSFRLRMVSCNDPVGS